MRYERNTVDKYFTNLKGTYKRMDQMIRLRIAVKVVYGNPRENIGGV